MEDKSPSESTQGELRLRTIRIYTKSSVRDIMNESDDWLLYGGKEPSWEELRDSFIRALFEIENEHGSQDGYQEGIMAQGEDYDEGGNDDET